MVLPLLFLLKKPMLHLLRCIKSTLGLFHLDERCSHEKTKRKSATLETTVPLARSNRAGLGLWARAVFELQIIMPSIC